VGEGGGGLVWKGGDVGVGEVDRERGWASGRREREREGERERERETKKARENIWQCK